ncbi:hypothetical protein BH18THE2_BH18THE2_23000 [soil metagenome]
MTLVQAFRGVKMLIGTGVKNGYIQKTVGFGYRTAGIATLPSTTDANRAATQKMSSNNSSISAELLRSYVVLYIYGDIS